MKYLPLKIKVSDNFTIRADRYNYILVETYESLSRETGKLEIRERESYYPSIEQCVRAVRQHQVKLCEGIDELMEALQRSYTLDKEVCDDRL